MFKAILFDLDGLLIDSERIYRKISYEMADAFGKTLHDGIWAMQMGRSPLESLTIFRRELGITSHSAQELVEMRNLMLLEKFREELLVLPGVHEIIEAFHGKLRMAVATGSPRVLMELAIDRLGLDGYFEYLLPSDDLKAGKPDPEIYLLSAAALGLEPDECIVLEDSSNGALSGHRAGCYVIAVPSEYTCNQDFSFCDFVAEGLPEACEHIKDLLAGAR